jgi:hypothetical protein
MGKSRIWLLSMEDLSIESGTNSEARFGQIEEIFIQFVAFNTGKDDVRVTKGT